MRLQGKVALITGASRGIGRCIAETFASQGADVVINFCRSEGEAHELARTITATYHVRAEAIQADVSDSAQVQAMVEGIAAQFDRLDILVNNAGIHFGRKFADLTEEDWDRTLAINLKGAFLCARAASERMLRQGSGAIVSLASMRGIVGGGSSLAYDVSKAGVITLTKSLAAELAPTIRVNCLAPGYIATDLVTHMPPERLHKLQAAIPLKQLGSCEDVANAALFLATDDAAYITGATLAVTGGFVMH